MYKLYGHAVSNYFNMIKLVLLEKGIEFEEVHVSPSQEEDFLRLSPMGKIPALETPQGVLTETVVALEYLEDAHPEHPLYPGAPYEKALVRRLCHMGEIYIDLLARPIFMKDLLGVAEPEHRLQEIEAELTKGAKALAKLAPPSPWMIGEQFTAADIVLYFTLLIMTPPIEKHLQLDLFELMPGYGDWYQNMASRELVKAVSADIEPAWEGMQKRISEFLAATAEP